MIETHTLADRLRAASKGLDHEEIAARLAAIREGREVKERDMALELERLRAVELERQAENGKPLLGICLGMQLLFEKSYEYGEHAGLGLLPGSVCPLEPDLAAAGFSYKVPHIGWNSLHLVRPENPLMANTREGDFVYFVHSFYAKGCGDALEAGAEYGVTVPGAVARGNVYGCQFHPEKSGEAGLRILRAFAAL